MSKILDSKDFGSKIYDKFPLKYREDDTKQGYALQRYINSLSDGGFKHSIDEMNGILNLIDPVKVDSNILPVLFEQYGLEVFNGIPEEYLRYLLPNIGEAWSKKGSLSVVEFVTSSLSGIQTTTSTTYDDQGNPTISVKLRMDYSIGDYFPEVGQFSRLLKNFIPFYCDSKLIYSYVFYENPILKEIDEVLKDKVSYYSNEKRVVDLKDHFNREKITEKVLETIPVVSLEKNLNIVTLAPVQDTPRVRGREYSADLPTYYYYETGGFKLKKEYLNPLANAMFGEAIMGSAVFNAKHDYVDTIKDHFVSKIDDGGKLSDSSIDTFTNKEYNTLNNSFFTNGLFSYDIITIGDTTEVVY